MVGEAPGADEVREGRPFVGANGQELQRALNSARLQRRDLHLTNVMLCQPPKNELDNLLAKVSSDNKERTKRNQMKKKQYEVLVRHQPWLAEPEYEALVPTPIECCSPRLKNEVQRFTNYITLGGTASKVIMNTTMNILGLRGGMAELEATKGLPARRVLPTVHPSFVLRAPRWSHVFRNDLHRASRWFRGGLNWVTPNITYHPTAAWLESFLNTPGVPYWTYDLETDGIEPLTAKIRCVGIGSPDGQVALVGLLSKDGISRFYTGAEEQRVIAVMKHFFTDPTKMKVGHNCLYFGTPVILADGSSEPIEKLVRSQYSGCVKALNKSGEIVDARVTGWFRTVQEGQEWLVVRRGGEKSHSRGLTLTPDHEVYTNRGRVRADELMPGDQILSGERALEEDERQALLGTLLGDSSARSATSKSGGVGAGAISVARPLVDSMTAVIRGSHSDPELVRQKNEWLGGLLRIRQERRGGGYVPDSIAWAYRTPQLRQISDVCRLVYREDGKRHIGRDILDALGPVGLAWLYADDGFKHKRPDRKRENVLIATCGFDDHEIEEARRWFTERFGSTTITAEGSLRLGVEASQVFAAHIAPFLLPAARYKLPKGEWPAFVGSPARRAVPHTVDVLSVERFDPPTTTPTQKTAARTRWCLQTTEGNFLTGFGFVKNCGSYDSNVLNAQWGIWPTPQLDTIMLHRLVESELPHSLGFVGSMYTDAPAWKCDREGRKIAFDAESDEQLFAYCGMDVAVTARVVPPLFDSVKARGQMDLVGLDHQVQRICAEMHMVGMWVDQDKRLYFEKKYITEVGKRLEDLRVSAPTADFNPGSPHQIRKILFNQWGLVSPLDERDRYTASGDPATSDDVLRSLLTLQHLTDEQRNFVLKLRRYRKAQKLLGTYVVKLRPSSMQAELGWDDDEDFEDAEMRKKYSLERTGIVDPRTGRMHPGYNAHVAVTGRLSSSKPINAQNFPKGLRAMVTAAPGNVLIGADADQLELRIAAALWGAKRYLRAFDASADPHSSTALACFPERFKQAEGFPGGKWDGDLFIPDGTGKWSGQAKTFRDLAKRVQYASQYMATVETVHRVICQTETENGDGTTSLPYLHLSLREVREMHQAWLDGCPEFPQGWEREVGEWRKQTYLVEPITGRRRDFLDGENPNELVNFKIQGGAAGLMNKAIVELANRVPVFKWGLGTGIINQCHDALVLEVPMDTAELRKKNNPDTGKEESFWHVPEDSIPGRVMQELNECMNQVHPALPGVKITAAADIGLSWKEVG
jgi:DNA polymerase I-like protein with 3'-5' exonuclease and polymerase domains/uracil-DNA glycosylase